MGFHDLLCTCTALPTTMQPLSHNSSSVLAHYLGCHQGFDLIEVERMLVCVST